MSFKKFLKSCISVFISTTPIFAQSLVVYTYDSFNSKWGPGPVVFKNFEKECDCQVKVVAPGDAGTVLSRVILEKNKPKADILLGISDSQLALSFQHQIWQPYQSKHLGKLRQDLLLDKQHRITPYDFGYIAFVYDSQTLPEPPKSLEELTDPKFKGKIVIPSAKTSSPGLSLLHWTIQVYGQDGFLDYWSRLAPNLLTVTDGWSSAYGMFQKGEAPIVLSYVTSPAYHLENEQTERYKAMSFQQGLYRQIEFAGIIKGTKNEKLAQQFIDFMLTKPFQSVIPTTNWMYPAVKQIELPESFRIAPMPQKSLMLNYQNIAQHNKKWVKDWTRTMSQ